MNYKQQRTLEFLKKQDYNSILELHYGLVRKIAGEFKSSGVEYDDIVQWGLIEMYKCCQSYDSTKGMTFSSYSARNIRRTIKNKLLMKTNAAYTFNSLDDSDTGYEVDYDYNLYISEILSHVFDVIDTDIQWIAITAALEDWRLSHVAKEIGCSHQNLSAAYHKVINNVKMELNI